MSSMSETFLEPTRLLLFGKLFPELKYDPPANPAQPAPGDLPLSVRSLPAAGNFARIYGFSYEGHYYKLPRPLLFLVQGNGTTAIPQGGGQRFRTHLTGVEAKDWQFGNDILVWAVDERDVAVRLDLEIGTFDRVLLKPSIGGREEVPTFRNAIIPQGRMIGPHQNR
jgi:hypothetical protein